MPLAVMMRNQIDPIIIDGDYTATINNLNIASASGKKFILADLRDGQNVAISIDNVNAIIEQEDDAFIA